MIMVGIVSHESGEIVWVNPDQMAYVELAVDGTGSYTLIHLTSGEVLPVDGSPQNVVRALVGSHD